MADFFHNIKDTLGDAFSRKKGSVLGVDVSSSTIKVVQLRKKGGKAFLETYGELALGVYAGVSDGAATRLGADTMAGALRDLMREAKASTVFSGVAVPLSSSLVRVIRMPAVGERRLKQMVPIEMRKYVPVNISEVLLDWRVIPHSSAEGEGSGEEVSDKTEILVVAIHKETISRYQGIVRDAGLQASFFEIEVFSTIRAVLDSDSPPAMVIDLGAATTKLYIVERRVLRESHSINRGSQDITLALSKSLGVSAARARDLKHTYGLLAEGEHASVKESIELVLDGILAEAARVMRRYQEARRINIGLAVLSGGGAGLKGLPEAAARALEAEVKVAEPFANVVSPAFLDDVLSEAGPEFAVAVGAALRKLDEEE